MTTQPEGFHADPPTGPGPGVLVLHAWWGLNDTIRAICRRLADAGFSAFAPDLYGGRITDTIPGAEALSSALDPAHAKATIGRGVDFLAGHTGGVSRGLSVIGFSLGAYFALELATADPGRVRSVVLFYGTGGTEHGASRASYLGHFAEHDPFEPASSVKGLEQSLGSAGRPVTFHTYPATGHWFFEPDRTDAYDAEAATLAWRRTLEFLRGNEVSRSSG